MAAVDGVGVTLRRTRESVHEQVMDLFGQYLAPNDPRFDPGALGGAYVELPS
jgi:hypothetical protein